MRSVRPPIKRVVPRAPLSAYHRPPRHHQRAGPPHAVRRMRGVGHPPRVPWYAKVVAACVAAYAFSPIALIPDCIPVLGYLDDVIIVPLGILLAIRLIPPALREEHRRAAIEQSQRRPTSYVGVAIILMRWLVTGITLLFWFERL
jgi:hypothetical protein